MYSASSLIQTPLFMLDLGSVQINEFVQISEIVKYSVNITGIMMVPTLKTDFYLNIGPVTSMAFSRCFPNQKYSASSSFGYSTIFNFSSHSCQPIFLRTFQVCATIVDCPLLHSVQAMSLPSLQQSIPVDNITASITKLCQLKSVFCNSLLSQNLHQQGFSLFVF